MKRIAILLLVAVMLLTAGCKKERGEPTIPSTTDQTTAAVDTTETTQEATQTTTEAPTEPVPECMEAQVKVYDAPAILMFVNRGDTVDVVDEFDEDHYVIKTEAGYGLVEKQFLRLSDAEPYKTWTGYAAGYIRLYANHRLDGEPLQSLSLNTKMEVLEELKYSYLVKLGDTLGFVKKGTLSTYYIEYNEPEQEEEESSGQDGGDISLFNGGVTLLAAIEQSGEVTGTAEVLVDEVPVILGYFHLGEIVEVVAEEGFVPAWEGYHTLYLNGFYAYMPMNLTLDETEEPYASWDGYCGYNAYVYDNYYLLGKGDWQYTNTLVTVLWDGGEFYVVSVDGEIGYMDRDEVSQSKYHIETGGGSNDSGEEEESGDWTPPAL